MNIDKKGAGDLFLTSLYICLVLSGEASVTMGTYVHRLHIICVVYVYRFLQFFLPVPFDNFSEPFLYGL
jgi:hypothetical protein